MTFNYDSVATITRGLIPKIHLSLELKEKCDVKVKWFKKLDDDRIGYF